MNYTDRDFPGTDKKIGIIGVPLGYAAGTTGSELGATAIRLAKLHELTLSEHIENLGYQVKDHGDVEIIKPDYVADANENPKYLKEYLASCKNISHSR